jgi:hypothetical protein
MITDSMNLKCRLNSNVMWHSIERWPLEYLAFGTLVKFLGNLPCGYNDLLNEVAMLMPSFRYRIRGEIYGITGSISGSHIFYIPCEQQSKIANICDCPADGNLLTESLDYCMTKEWVISNWDDAFKHFCPPLNKVLFGFFNHVGVAKL